MPFDIATVADTVTKSVIAVLGLVAAAVVVLGLVRAWRGRLHEQVVIEDVAAGGGVSADAVASLSPALRQAVKRALGAESLDASYAQVRTIADDIKGELLVAHGTTSVTEVAATALRSSAEDSLSTLSAGIGAVAPDHAAGLVGVLTAALPAQRGWRVRALPTVRGSGSTAEIGINLELGPLGQAPDSVTTFWSTSEGFAASQDDANRTAAIGVLLHRLLEPASLWIAIRLVSRSLRHTPSPARWAQPRGRERRRELAGMQVQLAGQLSLYASRKLEEYDLGFAEQALSDLAEASRLLPGYFRPHSTIAAVRERIGWSHRREGLDEPARRNFAEAVRAYDQATERLRSRSGAAAEAATELITARRTKCRILSEDPGHLVLAKTEIAHLDQVANPTSITLYNAACLFAVAAASPVFEKPERIAHERRAWNLLGRSLLVGGAEGPWDLSLQDVELAALELGKRRNLYTALKTAHPEVAKEPDTTAGPIVERVLEGLGVPAPDRNGPDQGRRR
jgi:hypothetical protein